MASERVLVRKVTDLARDIEEALDFLGYDFSGKRVWVKPNLLAPHRPERGVTTDPEVVRHVVLGLKRRQATQVWVADNPGGGLQRNVETYIAPTGVVEASEGCFRSISEAPVTLPMKSRLTPEVRVSHIITEVDVILSLPVFKTHALTILTGAIKNLFGLVPGGQKSHLHTLARSGDDFGELLVDIYQAVPVPVLTIMDASRGMDGQNGPSGGRVLSIGKLLASRNPVALDQVMAAMAGARPEDIPTNRMAVERGLGPSFDQIDIVGDYAVIPGFRRPSTALSSRLTGVLAAVAYPLLERRPMLDRKSCTRCGRCAENCPVQAIALEPYPSVDRDKCIMCYCCAELCPKKAMSVPSPVRGAIRNITRR